MTAIDVEVQVGTTPQVDVDVQVSPPTFTVIDVLPTGPRGPAGPEGPEGPEGPAGSAALSYSHTQPIPAADWVIAHNLGYRPAGIRAFDSAETEWIGDVEHVDENNLILHFVSAFGGRADFS